ncbi:MAG: carboxypeptidase-like regulatory domain-containing protein, partial [Flavobacteriaceae bacterium]|nr:carboxypeptidase-like regulatory domain-containing protein [Flavobacteriaceae bacterium]
MIKKYFLFILIVLFIPNLFSQVKVSGYIVDEQNNPVSFSNVIFKGSTKGTISDENGKFYLQSETYYNELEISFVGFETK